MIDNAVDSEYLILENIYDSSEQAVPLRQRDLAHIAGISLGMTNSILRRLAQKGWITIRKLNSRTIHYAVTLDGINEIIRRSYGYFKRTIRNMVYYKDRIDEALYQAKKKSLSTALLIGPSDLDFIVEHGCDYYGITLFKVIDKQTARDALGDTTLAIYAEGIPKTGDLPDKNALYLSRMVIKNPQAREHEPGV
jgi:DNA-binding MarR family transcriptional regulator